MSIKTILFDLDETLLIEDASDNAALIATCRSALEKHEINPEKLPIPVLNQAHRLWHSSPFVNYCQSIGISKIEGLWGNFEGIDPNLKKLKEWVPVYQRNVWATALAEQDFCDFELTEYLVTTFRFERSSRHFVFDDVITSLDELTGKYRLGLVTNGAPAIQEEKIMRSNLESYFDVIIISGKIGTGKPNILPFKLALSQLGSSAANSIMIGDSIEHDILGAKRLGLKGIWLNRANARHEYGLCADMEIRDLGQLKEHLQ